MWPEWLKRSSQLIPGIFWQTHLGGYKLQLKSAHVPKIGTTCAESLQEGQNLSNSRVFLPRKRLLIKKSFSFKSSSLGAVNTSLKPQLAAENVSKNYENDCQPQKQDTHMEKGPVRMKIIQSFMFCVLNISEKYNFHLLQSEDFSQLVLRSSV